MKKRIGWEPWKDPFNFEYDIDLSDDDDDDDDDEKSDWEKKEKQKYDPKRRAKGRVRNMPIIPTKHGPHPLPEYARPGYLFNFWVGHTNFKLTEDDCETLDSILGVETLDVFTPYRFRIGIGKMFKFANVRARIHNFVIGDTTLQAYMSEENAAKPEDIKNRIQTIRETTGVDIFKVRTSEEYPLWAFFMLPNGNHEILQSDVVTEDFTDKLKTLESAHQKVGGVLLTYMDDIDGELSK